MRRQAESLDASVVSLERTDIIRFEHALKDALSAFLPFKSYSLYLPQNLPPNLLRSFGPDCSIAAHHPDQRELLIPLVHQNELLAIFIARGVRLPAPKTMCRVLPQVASLWLDKLALHKTAITDELTGLLNPPALTRALEREISLVQDCILPTSSACMDPDAKSFSGSVGIVLFDLDHFATVTGGRQFEFSETLLQKAATALSQACPEGALPARLGDDVFALLLPGISTGQCRQVAESVREALSAVEAMDPHTEETVSLTASAGFAIYPQHLRGRQFTGSVREQARILIKKAQRTVTAAKELGRNRVLAFPDVVAEAGLVLETLPLSRLTINLGRHVDAVEGQRFLVWSPQYETNAEIRTPENVRLHGRYPTMIKAEILVMEVQDDIAFAEIVHLRSPEWPVEIGDRLLLASDTEHTLTDGSKPTTPQKDLVTGLYGLHDFLRNFARKREKQSTYSLMLMRLPEESPNRSDAPGHHCETQIRDLAELCRESFAEQPEMGRYSTSSLIIHVADKTPEEILPDILALCQRSAESLEINPVVGIAGYPFLHFNKADTLENCRKALDHAMLLTEPPKVAVFDSISLTVSADRLFTAGDVYEAIEEYKLALIADDTNILARNSLSACLTRVGRLEQAAAELAKVIAMDSKNAMALYNYGHTLRRIGETAQARKAFQKCLKTAPDSPAALYSLLRLGQMAEESRQFAVARKYYNRAAALPGGEGETVRHLARLSLAQNRIEEARELFHQALTHNPNDASSMHSLAKLYLDHGEDPAIAESLARQSVAVRPDKKQFWLELARALTVQDRHEEARTALDRADMI
ncbi:tetratricopeptide repeat-containing diguanylate cyclase [Desulfovibrio inopinatus]|uniref:tetratricopeptide repeat-containing diguanylate cyclase n=1 Tax=Desulfovibrio inopinatus TaxID=102109 RepID=UPI000410287D|nr:GGDEF domain-containing protein [Desulfovibrio inopinatus]